MSNPLPERVRILHDGAALTAGQRDAEYGDPAVNMAASGALKATFRQHMCRDIGGAELEAIEMALTKLGRIATGDRPKRDTYVDAATYLAIAGEIALKQQVANPESLAAAVDLVNGQGRLAALAHLAKAERGAAAETLADAIDAMRAPPIDRRPSPFWNVFNRKKEPDMATELETIAAAVARSTANSEKTLALVAGMSTKLDNLRRTTTDPNTATQLLALSAQLNAESDAVDAADVVAQADLDQPDVPPAPAGTPPVAPAPVPPVTSGEDPGSPGTPVAPPAIDPNAPADPTTTSTQSQTTPVDAPVDGLSNPPVDPET